MAVVLTEAAEAVWRALQAGPREVGELVATTGLDQSRVVLVAGEGEAAGHLVVTQRPRDELEPAEDLAAQLAAGLPERRGAALLAAAGGAMAMPDFVAACQAAGLAMNEVIKFGGARGWITRGKEVALTEAGQVGLTAPQPDEIVLDFLKAGARFADELPGGDAALKLLAGRTTLVKIRKRTERIVALTPAGQAALAAGITVKRERNALTQDDLRTGAWRDITLRPYDVTLPAATLRPARLHPVRRIIEQTRRAFLELGFEEVASPAVESAFWNFDALFQPQDHPARDMQDTFYMADPAETHLPDSSVVSAVKAAHENGGETGSTGWGYAWKEDRARKVVLRTHTTAATIRALARHPEAPYKAFCVGWTHRNETLSFKHLPVFHQVDGIIIDEHANLSTLLGTLKAFYQKMGFEGVRFKPAFYPYTEPSVDVMVYMESRKKWIEMGGSGIFRPEVTEPLGCKHPVLAWGLGIERLAMLKLGFSDIRELYQGGLDTVEAVPLCR
jgi:phenylalanyl-tRNA synthetase alpha chain